MATHHEDQRYGSGDAGEVPTRLPPLRLRAINAQPLRAQGKYILYWMIASRRPLYNYALQRAVEWATALRKPLVVLEALRSDYPFASDRLHRFVIDGMCDNEELLREQPVLYYPYVECERGAGRGLLEALAAQACVVVTDDAPVFFLPKMIEAAGQKLDVRLEAVDANGLLPLCATARVFQTAASFRTYLRKHLAEHVEKGVFPQRMPLERAAIPLLARLSAEVEQRWPRVSRRLLDGDARELASLPIDHQVPVVAALRGGAISGQKRLRHFLANTLGEYPQTRAQPERDGTSRLSPYLHFGHVCAHEVYDALRRREGRRAQKGTTFGLSEAADSFLDELVTWRELSLNHAHKLPGPPTVESLPGWARATLERHREDPRPSVQPFESLENGTTPDRVFNAAQRQLREEGWFHNAMRMIWGKKLLEYTPSPEAALDTMMRLMNRWSLDGRDPCSISGAAWVLGRYDRPWGPERPIFGTVRFMTSNTPDKLRRYREYVERWAPLAP